MLCPRWVSWWVQCVCKSAPAEVLDIDVSGKLCPNHLCRETHALINASSLAFFRARRAWPTKFLGVCFCGIQKCWIKSAQLWGNEPAEISDATFAPSPQIFVFQAWDFIWLYLWFHSIFQMNSEVQTLSQRDNLSVPEGEENTISKWLTALWVKQELRVTVWACGPMPCRRQICQSLSAAGRSPAVGVAGDSV